MATADEGGEIFASKYDAVLSRWQSLERGWQATILGVALVLAVHLVA